MLKILIIKKVEKALLLSVFFLQEVKTFGLPRRTLHANLESRSVKGKQIIFDCLFVLCDA